jgi:hypothetical protein
MRIFRIGLAFGLSVVLASAASGAQLQAGFATEDITPPVGWRMSGYFYERLSGGIHDPLQAKAMVLREEDQRAALVFCDLIGMPAVISSEIRQRASRKTGIPMANIFIAATHTHTGPLYYGALREFLHQRAIEEHGNDPFEGVDYQGVLIDRLVALIVKADRALQPVELDIGKTTVPGLSFNRRYHMKNGSVQFNPGKTNENILRPAGPVDAELIFLAIKAAKRTQTISGLTSFALHADTVGGSNYGADFPGYIDRSLKRTFGPDFVSLFANGPCGDINHVNVSDPRPQKGDEEAQRIGGVLAGQIGGLLGSLHPVKRAALTVRSTLVKVPLQQYSREQIAQARENMKKIGTSALPFLQQVESYKIMDLQWRNTNALLLPVQVFRLGSDTAIVALPGEIFTELGVAIKKQSRFANTIIVELANDSIGYVPTKKAFREGSYEVVNSRVQPGGGEMLVEAAIGLLTSLQ